MTTTELKKALETLGQFLSQFSTETPVKSADIPDDAGFFDQLSSLIPLSQSHNGWFTPDQVRFALSSWADALSAGNLDRWLSGYDLKQRDPKKIGLILAGNIPLVGFHDFLSVLVTGHTALVKLSSNDQKLLPLLANYLISVEPKLAGRIQFTDGKLEGFDAVIATGSDNTARYFEYYFRNVPAIIRKNRNSVAVLSGKESREEIAALGEDIFRYFGLGCRNVSKLFVPEGYDFASFFEGIFPQGDVIHYEKYANNYDYNKAVFLMSQFKILDNGFLTIKEDSSYASPISSVFYEFYSDLSDAKTRLSDDTDKIQCIVSSAGIHGQIAFGQTQKPQLWDYADNVDTVDFLNKL